LHVGHAVAGDRAYCGADELGTGSALGCIGLDPEVVVGGRIS
jgi:hypothetical protein